MSLTPAVQKGQPRCPPSISDPLYVAQITLPTASGKKQTLASKLAEQARMQMGDGEIPAKYQCHIQVFSEEASRQFPEPHIWDHAIKLKPGAPSSMPRKVYQLTQEEQKALLSSFKNNKLKGTFAHQKAPMQHHFSS